MGDPGPLDPQQVQQVTQGLTLVAAREQCKCWTQ